MENAFEGWKVPINNLTSQQRIISNAACSKKVAPIFWETFQNFSNNFLSFLLIIAKWFEEMVDNKHKWMIRI